VHPHTPAFCCGFCRCCVLVALFRALLKLSPSPSLVCHVPCHLPYPQSSTGSTLRCCARPSTSSPSRARRSPSRAATAQRVLSSCSHWKGAQSSVVQYHFFCMQLGTSPPPPLSFSRLSTRYFGEFVAGCAHLHEVMSFCCVFVCLPGATNTHSRMSKLLVAQAPRSTAHSASSSSPAQHCLLNGNGRWGYSSDHLRANNLQNAVPEIGPATTEGGGMKRREMSG